MENVLFGQHMSMRRDVALHDSWSLVASTSVAWIVLARSAASRRETKSIDLIAAYKNTGNDGRQHQTSFDHS